MGHLNVRSLVLSCAFMLGSVYNGHVYLVQAEDEGEYENTVFNGCSERHVLSGALGEATQLGSGA